MNDTVGFGDSVQHIKACECENNALVTSSVVHRVIRRD